MTNSTKQGDKHWTPTDVANRMEAAAITLKQLPSEGMQSYVCVWPEYRYSFGDMVGQSKPRGAPIRATPRDISQMEEVLTWWQLLEADEFKLVWARAQGKRWKAICPQIGQTRTTAHRNWMFAICKIAWQLNGNKINPKIGKDRLIGMVEGQAQLHAKRLAMLEIGMCSK